MSGKALGVGILALALGIAGAAYAANEAIPEMLAKYRAEGAKDFDPKRGEALWHKQFPAPADDEEGPKLRSCETCHGTDLTKPGKHYKTGKVIDPMAPSVNPERFSDPKKIRKWFRRNCKWVLGRECTPQEKGDVLVFLKDK
ncbi:MAG: DUF1924 domain-containing protein [Zetaproteobacteria bacterium]|nr:MAG: DUF1924 domain-containing protein [Zetaproteobacteria bacterium]